MFQDISLEDWRSLKDRAGVTTIDVRSPSEYKLATIPGSLNIPLFNDEERAEVGTLYKQTSIEAAKERGLEIVSAKLPSFIKEFSKIPGNKTVFCWRGGMRSKTTATVLSLMGIRSYRLTGGYRTYRQWVVDQLDTLTFHPNLFVLQGHTGCGKTEILHKLKEKGVPVLDLEGMAGHRGSIFGGIGLESHNQKMFDSLLLEEILTMQNSRYITIEAESRRVGKVVLPDLVMNKKENGVFIRIELPLEERVRQILQDYRPWEHPEACSQAFKRIKARIHTPIAHEIQTSLDAGKYEVAVEMLLRYYYDPRYAHSFHQYDNEDSYFVKAATALEAFHQVEQILEQHQQNLR
ncbi:tRNA 2-selenouridine(34) synthase MnmH [Paenibacillus sp. LHD-117]|uniref:tRNA 2-selenouridine(34) synthase MnmH n=1 Tax=Paenibacillus sp. LHD-117 TaxID=3071412 RepID=UPI0027DF549F|nr:tRNA 2-selenouridine(34) synthase MnmH [Paenibacillus sp. LHD-117]MDQ6421692.1 tRNA 2-selenouridine(34) synthase MnmH [Paenibacillus sp. LHD-117]